MPKINDVTDHHDGEQADRPALPLREEGYVTDHHDGEQADRPALPLREEGYDDDFEDDFEDDSLEDHRSDRSAHSERQTSISSPAEESVHASNALQYSHPNSLDASSRSSGSPRTSRSRLVRQRASSSSIGDEDNPNQATSTFSPTEVLQQRTDSKSSFEPSSPEQRVSHESEASSPLISNDDDRPNQGTLTS
jgi:hypothetical protein